MNITVLGAGNMGAAFVQQLTRAGHRVTVTARDATKAAQLAERHAGAQALPPAQAARDAEVIVLATEVRHFAPFWRGRSQSRQALGDVLREGL